MNNLEKALRNYIFDPKNAQYNFTLGYEYEKIGHTASAAAFFIRTSEFGSNELLIYESLLRTAICFEKQGSRVFTVKGILLRAVSLLPTRPEAYFLLSRSYEQNRDWQEAYTWASIAESLDFRCVEKLQTYVDYPGEYGFKFEKAVAAWWVGLFDESIHLFKQLKRNTSMLAVHTDAVASNLNNLNNSWKDPLVYDNSLYENLKVKFNGSSKIKMNHSQCYQDMFVLTMLNGKKFGTYVEIGCGDPFYGNNTALLEKEFRWNGVSLDIEPRSVNVFNEYRTNKAICADATTFDYAKELGPCIVIDYLQIDCDPPIVSYNALLKVPLDKYKFAVITFEHDHYSDEDSGIRDKSRAYLKSHGYELVVADVAPDKYNSFEDWWVHPELVSRELINKMKNCTSNAKKADECFIGRIC